MRTRKAAVPLNTVVGHVMVEDFEPGNELPPSRVPVHRYDLEEPYRSAPELRATLDRQHALLAEKESVLQAAGEWGDAEQDILAAGQALLTKTRSAPHGALMPVSTALSTDEPAVADTMVRDCDGIEGPVLAHLIEFNNHQVALVPCIANDHDMEDLTHKLRSCPAVAKAATKALEVLTNENATETQETEAVDALRAALAEGAWL